MKNPVLTDSSSPSPDYQDDGAARLALLGVALVVAVLLGELAVIVR